MTTEERTAAAAPGMEASRFGFDLPPAFKFDPTDADIVASYLLPRALFGPGASPYSHAVAEDDATSCEPWSLMRKHGHAATAHALFVRSYPDRHAGGGGRRDRVVKDGVSGAVVGCWRGQKSVEGSVTILRPGDGGGELDITYKRNNLSYYRAGETVSSGWVMHEYEIVSPPLQTTVLSRIRSTYKVKDRKSSENRKLQHHGEHEAAGVGAGADEPGPEQMMSHNYGQAHAGQVAGAT